MPRVGRSVLYIGGFLGPFGGGVVTSMLPEMGADLGVSTSSAATSLTAYLLPFALLMLFSGTLGSRWGQTRTVRIAYAVYVIASVACALAPNLWWFLLARVLQGSANSFTTPLLLSVLAATTPHARLGRALGTFGALQAAGQTSAPLVGGLAAEANWRLAFFVIAGTAALLGALGLPAVTIKRTAVRVRDAWRLDVLRIGAVALLGWGALGGLNFLVAFRAEDQFGLGPTARGLLLTLFGIVGIATARPIGGVIDRIGWRSAVVMGAIAGGALVCVVGSAAWLVIVGVAWGLAGAAGQGVLVGVNAGVLGAAAANRAGAVSVVQALRFTGQALAPVILTPVYGVAPVLAFVAPALLLAVAAPLVLPRSEPAPGVHRA